MYYNNNSFRVVFFVKSKLIKEKLKNFINACEQVKFIYLDLLEIFV